MANNSNNSRNGMAVTTIVGYIAQVFPAGETRNGQPHLDAKVLVNNGGSEPLAYMVHLYGERLVETYEPLLEVGKQVTIIGNVQNVSVAVDDNENVWITTHVACTSILLCGSNGTIREERKEQTNKLKAALSRANLAIEDIFDDDEEEEAPVKPAKKQKAKQQPRRQSHQDDDDE